MPSSSPRVHAAREGRLWRVEHPLARARLLADRLSDADQRISAFLERRGDEVFTMSIVEVARRCQTHPVAVVRYSRKLGYAGFPELKIRLAAQGGTRPDARPGAVRAGDGPSDVIRKVIAGSMRALDRTRAALVPSEVQRAVVLIERATRVDCYGMGPSGVVAEDACARFTRIGKLCRAATDAAGQAVLACQLTRGDVALAISSGGRSAGTVRALRLARAAGAGTVAICDAAQAPLLAHADVTLFAVSEEGPIGLHVLGSRLAQLAVVDVLFTSIAARRPEPVAALVARTARAMEEP